MLYDSSISKFEENGRTITLMSLALPKFFEQVFVGMLGTVSTLMLSGYSQEAVAATSIANQILNFVIIILNIIISGFSVVMSIELGRKDRVSAGKIAGTSTALILVGALALGVFTAIFADPLVGFMNLEGEAKILACDFLRIKSIFLFLTMLMSCFNNLLICNGYSGSSFIIGIFSNILGIICHYIVLYSGLDLPVEGVTGIAIASIFAQIISCLMAIGLFIKNKCPFAFTFDLKSAKKILRIGTPSGLGMISFTATQIFTTGFMASLGVMTLNTKVYVTNIISYVSKFGFSVATANGVIMGRYRGQNAFDKIKALYRQNMIITIASNLILSVVVFAFYKPLVSLYTSDSQVIALAAGVMAVDIIDEVARAINNISEKSLNANGDVKTTFIVPLFTCWIFGVFLAYILGIKCGMGLIGCWIGFAADEIAKATIYIIRWENGKWKNTKI